MTMTHRLTHVSVLMFVLSVALPGCQDSNAAPQVETAKNNGVRGDRKKAADEDEATRSGPKPPTKLGPATDIRTALAREVPSARAHLPPGHTRDQLQALLDEPQVEIIAKASLGVTRDARATSGMGVWLADRRVGVSVTTVPGDISDIDGAVHTSVDGGFDSLVTHFRAQVVAAGAPEDVAVIHVILVHAEEGTFSAAIGSSDGEGTHPPRQLRPRPRTEQPTKPAKVCDIDTSEPLGKIQPGEGYLLSPKEVAASERYWQSLDPLTRKLTKEMIAIDTSGWFVCERHIEWFDVDRDAAHAKAVEVWNAN